MSGLQNLMAQFSNNKEYILKKIVPTSIMFLITIFVYSVLRGVKDTLLVPVLGAEIISTLKLFGVFPSAVLFIIVYTKLANILSKERMYYTMTTFFISFFAIYAFIIYPNIEAFNIDVSGMSELMVKYPGIKYPMLMISNWASSLFYIMSELWGSVMLSLLFWQFANQIYKVTEAKNTYTIFGAIGQIGLIAAGFVQKHFSHANIANVSAEQAWQDYLQFVISIVFLVGLVLMFIYWMMSRFVLTDPRFYDPTDVKVKKKKEKLGFIESFKYIFTSKYIGLMAVLLLSYGISINLVEGVWKNQVRILYPIKNDYSAYMGEIQIWTGIASMIAMILGVYILRKFRWATAAILTPLMILVTGIAFFFFIQAGDMFNSYLTIIGSSSLMMAVLMGGTQNALSKATKYSLFDPTKEMAYIPLDDELKSKGKAVVDVTAARLGKSGGAIVQWLLISFVSDSLTDLTTPIMYIFLVIMVCWVIAVFALGKMFEEKTKSA